MGRRVKKAVYAYGSGTWELQKEILFVYDGWNLIHEKEVSAAGDPLFDKFYVWGLDLSQTLQGAGGVGGLVCRVSGGEVRHYFYDANGNVGQLVDPAGGAVNARYEYDPFGNAVFIDGADAVGNAFRFSTKFLVDVIGGYDFGLRIYFPEVGRWSSRDPIYENGGVNLYGFCLNNPLVYLDLLGKAYMKAFNRWIQGGANERVGTMMQKRMWGKEIYRGGIEVPHHFQNELSRLENEGYNTECFPDELMDQIYLEVRDYWRFEAMMAGAGLYISQIAKYVLKVVDNYYHGAPKKVKYISNVVDDPAAQKLAARLGGDPSVKFPGMFKDREFDVVSDLFIGQSKPANFKSDTTGKAGGLVCEPPKAVIKPWATRRWRALIENPQLIHPFIDLLVLLDIFFDRFFIPSDC